MKISISRYLCYFLFAVLLQAQPAVSQTITSTKVVNVRDFGAKGDGKTNDRGAFARAVSAINKAGGGKIVLTPGTYLIDAPIIINSNTILEGSGNNTIIQNNSHGSPWGNCIHVGVSREFSDWDGSFGKITDASLEQFDRKDFSKLTTSNVIVRNIRTKSTNLVNGGLGIFVLNARNVLIENITGDGNATPVNIGNDHPTLGAACMNVKVRNISNIKPGRWYDLVFVGVSQNVDIAGCRYKFSVAGGMNEIITIGGRNCRVHDNYIEYTGTPLKGRSKKAIDITADRFGFLGNNIVEKNTIINIPIGITLYNSDKNIIRSNTLLKNQVALRVYSRSNQIAGNSFKSNQKDLILETDAARGELTGNKGLDLKRITDKANLIKTYKIKK